LSFCGLSRPQTQAAGTSHRHRPKLMSCTCWTPYSVRIFAAPQQPMTRSDARTSGAGAVAGQIHPSFQVVDAAGRRYPVPSHQLCGRAASYHQTSFPRDLECLTFRNSRIVCQDRAAFQPPYYSRRQTTASVRIGTLGGPATLFAIDRAMPQLAG
jgi:hypothetical protein